MSKKPIDTPISDTVMERIRSGDVSMRSRTYFGLLTVLSVLAVLFAGAVLAYAASILFWWLRVQTADTMAWGARANLQEATGSFPWLALLGAGAVFGLLVWLVRKQGHLYRHRTRSVAAIIAVIALLLGLGLSYVSIGGSGGRHVPRYQRPDGMRQEHSPGWRRTNQ